jgi:serine protease Do
MSETSKSTNRARNNMATAGAVVVALAGGYALRGTQVTAQQANPNASTKTPIVQTPATNDAASMQRAFNGVSKAIEPAVVTITTERAARPVANRGSRPQGPGAEPFGGDPEEFFRRFFRDFGGGFAPNSFDKAQAQALWREVQSRGGGLGSGMIYREDGYIITNAHVVAGANRVTVKMNDGREFRNAKVVGSDERTDIAVVKIDGDKLPTVRLGDSGGVNVGDWAIAVGNPFGLEHTVTVGVISAKAREVPLNERSPGDYLQTDASINPGNSGGPLCDIYGRVIGVNNAIYSQSGGNVGIGFAIPINTAKSIADRLVQNGRIVRGYLGVQIQSVEDAQTAAGLGLDASTRGVLINDVTDPNGPGAKAGLQAGDVVIEFNGQKVTRSAELQRMVGDTPVGTNVTLRVLRNGQPTTLNARLTELKEEGAARPAPGNPNDNDEGEVSSTAFLGLRMRSITPQLAQRYDLGKARGVVVTGVAEGSAAAAAGIRAGDLIERVGQTAVTTPAEVQSNAQRILNRQGNNEQKSVGLYINRGGQRQFFFVDPTP